jgi:nucleotide-binding universal stress UspA family protein
MYRRIMIVVDDNDPVAQAAVTEGLEIARVHAAEVLFFHVLPDDAPMAIGGDVMPSAVIEAGDHLPYFRERADRALAAATARARALSVPALSAVASGADPAACVANAARERHCDLIVVGSHGRTALQRLVFGSLPASLLPLTPLPMLVCKRAAGGDGTDGAGATGPAVQATR